MFWPRFCNETHIMLLEILGSVLINIVVILRKNTHMNKRHNHRFEFIEVSIINLKMNSIPNTRSQWTLLQIISTVTKIIKSRTLPVLEIKVVFDRIWVLPIKKYYQKVEYSKSGVLMNNTILTNIYTSYIYLHVYK